MTVHQLLNNNYTVAINRKESATCITLCGETIIASDDELEDLEFALTDILHAISLYKRGLNNE